MVLVILIVILLMQYGNKESIVDICLEKESSMEFNVCLKEKATIEILGINAKPYEKQLLITSLGAFPTIIPGDGSIGYKLNYSYPTVVLQNSTEEYLVWLFDRNNFFPAASPIAVPRTSIKINKGNSVYVSLQVFILSID